MPVNSFIFTYKNMEYNFNAKPLNDTLFKVQFFNPVGYYSLPQDFLLNTNFTLVFLPEEPNAVYTTTQDAQLFLKSFSADLKKYMLEFA